MHDLKAQREICKNNASMPRSKNETQDLKIEDKNCKPNARFTYLTPAE